MSRYTLTFSKGRAPVELFVQVEENRFGDPPLTVSGRVLVTVTYQDPEQDMRERQFSYKEKIVTDCGELVLRVIDFALPPALRQCGIGTFIWSVIYRHLDPATAARLRLAGKLSSNDATVVQVDGAGRIQTHSQGGSIVHRTIPNISRRNDFWKRMLAKEDSRFVCGDDGEGSFEGKFVDPGCDETYGRTFTV